VLFLSLTILILGACDVPDAETTEADTAMTGTELVIHTDSQSLNRWIDLSRLPQPAQIQWGQQALGQSGGALPAPTDYYIVALLAYDRPTADLTEELDLASRSAVYVEDAFLQNWMPQAVLDRISRTTDGYMRCDGDAFAPGDLLLSPLTHGYVLFVENYVLIYGATT